jgi:hypothetical protein
MSTSEFAQYSHSSQAQRTNVYQEAGGVKWHAT